ncbi:MAG: YqhA family protein [Campylobacteraceae bacterium]|nr:YqhA family protein [Campylobacteraceae bacterium]
MNFGTFLWSSRLVTFLAVVFSFIGAVILFIVASYDIIDVAAMVFKFFFQNYHPDDFHADVVGNIIGAIDLYLMAIVMLIFSFGIYELFIGNIQEADESKTSKVLEIHSLDQLKDKVAKVIVMVLVVNFFQRIMHLDFTTGTDMLYFAISILALCVGLYFLGKGGNH